MKIRNQVEYKAVAGLLTLCRMLPKTWVYALFKGLGLLSLALLRDRRKLAFRNLQIVFPEMGLAERKRMVRKNFINLSESMAFNTLMMSGRISNQKLIDTIEVEGWEHIEQARRTAGERGFLLFSAHMGNWELLPQYAGLRLGTTLHVIARETTNPLLEERIVRPLRERFGVNVLYKKKAIMNMMKALKKGEPVGLLIDQKLKPPMGIPLEFFGREAPTTATSALLQVRFGIVALPIFAIKTAHRKYRLIVREPVPWTDNGKPMDDQVAELTSIHQKIIEEMILQFPDQWFWMHNRWNLKKGER